MRGWQIEEQTWQPQRQSISLTEVKSLPTWDRLHSVSFYAILCPRHHVSQGDENKELKWTDDIRDGWCDGWHTALILHCVFRVSLKALLCICIMLQLANMCYSRSWSDVAGHHLLLQQWKCLTNPGLRTGNIEVSHLFDVWKCHKEDLKAAVVELDLWARERCHQKAG